MCGPPCGGKTTYVDHHAEPGDTVIDYDDIARELGSPVSWRHSEPFASAAHAETNRRIDELVPSDRAWVIRSMPRAGERAQLAERLQADVVMIDPGEAECLRRAASRPSGTRRAIGIWYWNARQD